MSLAPTVLMAPNFTAHELGADLAGISAAAQANLYKVAGWLQEARGLLGTPLAVSSGYRSPEHNATLPGASSTSDHMTGLAADFTPRTVSQLRAYQLLKAGPVPPFDQLIFYPVTGHIHVGLGARMRREFRIALAEGGYPLLSGDLVAKLRGAAPALLLIVAVVLLVAAAAQKGA